MNQSRFIPYSYIYNFSYNHELSYINYHKKGFYKIEFFSSVFEILHIVIIIVIVITLIIIFIFIIITLLKGYSKSFALSQCIN